MDKRAYSESFSNRDDMPHLMESAYNTSEMQEFSADNAERGSLVENAKAKGSVMPTPPIATRQSKRVKIVDGRKTNEIAAQQQEALNTTYARNNTPTNSERLQIAINVGVSLQYVDEYFRDRRAREKEPQDLTPVYDDTMMRRKRLFSQEQHVILNREYAKNPHPSMKERKRIAAELDITNVVRNYFQNRNRKGENSKPHKVIGVEEDKDEETGQADSPRMTIFGTPVEPFPDFVHEYAASTMVPRQNGSPIAYSSSYTRPAVAAQSQPSMVVKLPVSRPMQQQNSTFSTPSALSRPGSSLDNTPTSNSESVVTITTIVNAVAKLNAENAQLQSQKEDLSALIETGRQEIDNDRQKLQTMRQNLERLQSVQEEAVRDLETTNQRIKAIEDKKSKFLSKTLRIGADFGGLLGDGE